ncbi:MAG: FG-GAP repeat domain-containing protein [Thermoleophilia bacterium]
MNNSTGGFPRCLNTGDFNQDGATDLVTANGGGNSISILQGARDGSFSAAVNHDVGTVPYSVTTGDFNSDGKLDLAVANNGGNNVSILLNNPTRNYYWTWYDNVGGDNWVLMANPNSASRDLSFNLAVGGRSVELAGFDYGVVVPGRNITPIYAGIMGGPVRAGSKTGDSALLSQRTLWPKGGNSLEEVLAVEETKRSDHYYWTWYDESSAGYQDWILIANNNAAASVFYEISIGGASKGTGTIAAGQKVTPHFQGVIGGPVEVQAWTDDTRTTPANVMASQRVLSSYGNAFNEVPGTPATDLKSDYLWTWYDQSSPGATDWVLVANPSDSVTVDYEILIGGHSQKTGTLLPGQRVTPTFPGMIDGPVEVKSTGGNVIASQRVIWGPSFEEVPGMSAANLANNYRWTWYDASAAGVQNWVLIANPSATEQIDYQILIGGVPQPDSASNPGTILAGQRVTSEFPGQIGGPVEVRAWLHGSSWSTVIDRRNVMTSQRVLWKVYFNEVLGTVLP